MIVPSIFLYFIGGSHRRIMVLDQPMKLGILKNPFSKSGKFHAPFEKPPLVSISDFSGASSNVTLDDIRSLRPEGLATLADDRQGDI